MPSRGPHPSTLRTLRTFAIAWTVACGVLGALATWQVLELRSGTDAMTSVGNGLERTSSSLDTLADLPLVGRGVSDAAEAVGTSGATVRDTADDLRRTVLLLAVLVGLAIMVMPTAPVLFAWWLLARSGE